MIKIPGIKASTPCKWDDGDYDVCVASAEITQVYGNEGLSVVFKNLHGDQYTSFDIAFDTDKQGSVYVMLVRACLGEDTPEEDFNIKKLLNKELTITIKNVTSKKTDITYYNLINVVTYTDEDVDDYPEEEDDLSEDDSPDEEDEEPTPRKRKSSKRRR